MAATFQFQVVFLFLLGVFLVLSAEGRVIELDDSFRELKKNGYWFVEFYAPWCGHCKNLEPIWREVGEELSKSNTIVTAKLDCTVYRDLAEEMGVHGFPTIKFFRGKFSATYQGSRTKKELVEFALKASRPILTELKTTKEFERRQTKADVFFLFVRNNEKISEEYEEVIREVAESKIAHAVFYSIKDTILPKDVKVDKVPGLIVIKDNVILAYEDEGEALNKSSISSWVDHEKFLPFLIVTESNVDALADTGKMIVFATFAKESEKKKRNLRLGEVVKEMSLDLKSRFSKKFQFAGVFQRDIIESIMMGTAEYPFILVLNPHSRVYYILHSSAISESFSAEELTAFLDDVLNGKATAHGGRTFSQRMWRIWWDIRGSAKDIWRASPFMAIVIFGLPCLVFTFLIVMLCCLEAAPDNEEYEEHMEERGERGDERDTDGEALASSTTYNRLKSD